MLDLALLAPTSPTISTADILSSSFNTANTSTSVLGQSRRPAILTYASSLVEHAYKLSNLPWYMIGWKKESEALEVSMFEGVQFAKGWRNIPDQVKIVIEADEKMQFYEVSVKIRARFQGLRQVIIFTARCSCVNHWTDGSSTITELAPSLSSPQLSSASLFARLRLSTLSSLFGSRPTPKLNGAQNRQSRPSPS